MANAGAAPKVEKAVQVKITQNGVVRPSHGTGTGRIWEIADAVSAAIGAPAPRKDVLAQTTVEGINPATAATQYGKWRKFNGLEKEKGTAIAKAEAAAEAAATEPVVTPADVTVE